MSLKAKLALIIVVFCWASAFVGIRAGLMGYSPGGLALLRFLIASTVMAAIFWYRPRRKTISFMPFLGALGAGAVGIGLYNIALNYGEQVISSGMASFIISQAPVFTTLLAFLFLREKITSYCLMGMMISVAGVGLMLVRQEMAWDFYWGMLFVFVATILGAFYSIFQKALLKQYDAIDLAAYAIWGGTLLLLVFSPQLLLDFREASPSATLTVVYLGIFPGAIAYLAWNVVLNEIPASKAVSFLYFLPIVATFIGWIWLGESPTLLSLIGGSIALIGVAVVNYSFRIKPLLTSSPAPSSIAS